MSQQGLAASVQELQNSTFDSGFGVLTTEGLGYDGQSLQRLNADNQQIYSVTSGIYTYFCFAAPWTALATAKWRIFRLDTEANLMFADADANFDNVATDPTSLSYSYA